MSKRHRDTGSFEIIPSLGPYRYGDTITFDVTSTALYPMVEVVATQDGIVVYRHAAAFYAGSPFSQDFPLMGWAWTGGAADCHAELYSVTSTGARKQTLDQMDFDVDA